ncbi:putative C-type lectin domain family 20 member A [Siphateles boraxobius]|uniref:putative C-type lectin domain family 20 member A n=1 Tax=Siphateles boraxobius TaxID=180520 RepID=UPI004062C47A
MMDQICLPLLSLSGLLSLTLCNPHEYVLIRELMPWGKAQNYCRENHIDLATVQSVEDWTTLQEVADEEKYRSFSWIGLYNDINSWRWSYQEESLVFQSWFLGQPDNYGSGEECVAIYFPGDWRDFYCDQIRYFVCSNEKTNATEKLVLIKMLKTWFNAQKYCREHYTDLATIRSLEDNKQIVSLINGFEPWIGLYRESWKWSDQANFTSSTQLTAQRLNGWGENCAGLFYYSNSIDDYYCTSLHYFYCNTVKSKQQVIRVQVKASENADDATLSALVLNKLQQMLSDQDVTLTWKKQPNGKIFQKKNTIRKASNASTPVYCDDVFH